jgi:hypothetical protein
MVCGLWLLFGKEHQRRCRRECFEWTEQLTICPNRRTLFGLADCTF